MVAPFAPLSVGADSLGTALTATIAITGLGSSDPAHRSGGMRTTRRNMRPLSVLGRPRFRRLSWCVSSRSTDSAMSVALCTFLSEPWSVRRAPELRVTSSAQSPLASGFTGDDDRSFVAVDFVSRK